jgi:hypothetical protein
MSTTQKLNEKLNECCEKLAECAHLVSQFSYLKQEKATYKIGKAIYEISEVRSALYERHPELKPELWDEPPTDQHFLEWFAEAKRLAAEYCEEGNAQEALKTYESFISIGPSEIYKEKARKEILLLKEKYGV